jgi:hypothetical protein
MTDDPSQAGSALARASWAARRRRSAAIDRIVSAYRRQHPSRRRTDAEILEQLADDLERQAEDHATAS